MNRLTVGSLLIVTALLLFGCSRTAEDPEEDIRALLAASGYTSDSHTRAYGSEDSTPAGGGDGELPTSGELPPFGRFIRYIPGGGVSREVNVQIPAYPGYPETTALATITVDIYGELRTIFDTTTNPMQVWRKPFHDRGTRRVYLTKNQTGWHIRRVTPLNIITVNAPYSLRLVRLHAEAASGEVFDLTDPDTLLSKEELPTFLPGDTVTVSVTLESDGDSCWVFLHRGRPGRPGRHFRHPYLKTGTFAFERTWFISSETYDVPEVRPSAHDAIGWGSLWADTTQPYVSNVWGVPYVVKYPNEQLPNDE